MRSALILALLLTACGGPNLHTVEQSCGANTRPFPETWPCVKAEAAKLPGPADLKRYYFATGDVVAERIRKGQMTEAEGRLAMADALTKAQSANAARNASADSGGPIVYQRVGPNTVIGY